MESTAKSCFEFVDGKFHSYVMFNAPLERLGEGYRWTEGPCWFADRQCLLFSDIPNNRMMQWSQRSGVTVFREPANFSNGNTRDREGRLITCSHGDRAITRTELNGDITILVAKYEGKSLNSPNDCVVKSDGTIWFTDPHYGINTDYEGGRRESELPANVYCFNEMTGSLTVVADDFDGPNGLCFSPDEKTLYIVETGVHFDAKPVQHIRSFGVDNRNAENARLIDGKIIHKIQSGCADGIRCDEHGNIWSSAGDGVHCLSPEGSLLGKILVPSVVSNITFGGRNRSRLFICAADALYAIYTNVRGIQIP